MSRDVKVCRGDGVAQVPHTASAHEFSTDVRKPDGLCTYCKTCAATRQRLWKRNNPDKVQKAKRDYRQNTQTPK